MDRVIEFVKVIVGKVKSMVGKYKEEDCETVYDKFD